MINYLLFPSIISCIFITSFFRSKACEQVDVTDWVFCVRWGLIYPKGAQPQFSPHICCGQTAGWITMPLGTKVDCKAVTGLATFSASIVIYLMLIRRAGT